MTAREIDALYEHIKMLFQMVLDRMEERFADQERATKLASDTLNARLEGMNEFRSSMKDQAARFVTRRELWGYLAAILAAVTTIITVTLAFHGG